MYCTFSSKLVAGCCAPTSMRASSSSTYEAKVAARLPPPEIAMPTRSSLESGAGNVLRAPSADDERSGVGAAHAQSRIVTRADNDAVRMQFLLGIDRAVAGDAAVCLRGGH